MSEKNEKLLVVGTVTGLVFYAGFLTYLGYIQRQTLRKREAEAIAAIRAKVAGMSQEEAQAILDQTQPSKPTE